MELEDDDCDDGDYERGWVYQLDDRWRPGDEPLPGSRPRGWLTASQVVAWIVWRETVSVDGWHVAFYPGAEEWVHPSTVQRLLMDMVSGHKPFSTPADLPTWLRSAFGRRSAYPDSRRIADTPELWPAAAESILEWVKGDWEPDPHLVAVALAAKDGVPPDPKYIEIAKQFGSDGGYARCLRNYDYFWKGSEALRRALAKGRLTAYGRPMNCVQSSVREAIPASVLAAPVTICVSSIIPGTVEETQESEPRPSPIWTDILLDAEAVVAVWPEYVAPDETAGPIEAKAAVSASADAWMAANAHGRKYDDAIATCMKEAGATNRAARAAWARLPGDVRGKRGPQRNS